MADRLEQALAHPETIPGGELEAWLRDDDFKSCYALAMDARRAMLGMTASVDSAEAFGRFKAAHGGAGMSVDKTPRRRLATVVWLATAAVAAAVLCLWLLRPANEPKSIQEPRRLVAGQVYEATPEAGGITITTGGKTTSLSGKRRTQAVPGITVTASGDIICQKMETDEAGDITSTITVPHGKVAKILLPDGTWAWVNTQSSITYPAAFPADGPREVTVQGEAYLEVRHDERHPFVVRAGSLRTTVLGTSFNIRAYEGSAAQVTLVSGRVKVGCGNVAVVLRPGQMAEGDDLKVSEVYTGDITCWREGQFAFSGQTLQEVMVDIGRWYNMNVIITNRAHASDKMHLGGERAWSVQEITSQIDAILGTHTTVSGNTIKVE